MPQPVRVYWDTVWKNSFDWAILAYGLILFSYQFYLLYRRWQARHVSYVQDIDRHRTLFLLLVELAPMAGLLGTVLSLMNTFDTFQASAPGQSLDLGHMVREFAPAMSTTISGQIVAIPNLFLNALLWYWSPQIEKGHETP